MDLSQREADWKHKKSTKVNLGRTRKDRGSKMIYSFNIKKHMQRFQQQQAAKIYMWSTR